MDKYYYQGFMNANVLDLFSKYGKFIMAAGGCLVLLSFIDKALAAGILVVVFLASVALFFISRIKEKETIKAVSALFLIVFLIHAAGVFLIHYTGFQPFSGGRGDYTAYHVHATEISNRLQARNFSVGGLALDHYYPVIIGYLYFLTLPSMLMGQLLNAWIVALTAVVVFLITKRLGGGVKEGVMAGLVACFYPSLFFYGSLLLKDALVIFLAAMALLLTIELVRHFSFRTFGIFYLVLAAATHFRFYIGYTLIFTFIISWTILASMPVKKRLMYGAVLIALIGFIPDIAMLGLGRQGYFGANNIKQFSKLVTILGYRDQGKQSYSSQFPVSPTPSLQPTHPPVPLEPGPGAPEPAGRDLDGNSSVSVDINFGNPTAFIRDISLSFVYVILGPFPWQLTQKRHLFTLLEMIPWYFLLFFIVRGISASLRRNHKAAVPLLIFCFAVFGILSFYINNFGIITRIRMPAFLVLLCFFPLGFTRAGGSIILQRATSFFKQIKSAFALLAKKNGRPFLKNLGMVFLYLKFTAKDFFLYRLFKIKIQQETFLSYRMVFSNYSVFRTLFVEIFILGQYDVRFKKPDPFIIDCGANVGMSLLFFKSLYPTSRIIAFEPEAATYALLQKNVADNGLSNVVVHNVALFDQDGEAAFHVDEENSGLGTMMPGVIRPQKLSVVNVKTKRLSPFIERSVDLLKVDVEGAEDIILLELEKENKLGLIQNIAMEYHPLICQKLKTIGAMVDFLTRNHFSCRQEGYASNYLLYANK
ncbi:MAG: FkbM family methyltransferase [bacterium]|nr:FkbM family methyltransferase [bacterium]